MCGEQMSSVSRVGHLCRLHSRASIKTKTSVSKTLVHVTCPNCLYTFCWGESKQSVSVHNSSCRPIGVYAVLWCCTCTCAI